jgi:hypothetical protein
MNCNKNSTYACEIRGHPANIMLDTDLLYVLLGCAIEITSAIMSLPNQRVSTITFAKSLVDNHESENRGPHALVPIVRKFVVN